MDLEARIAKARKLYNARLQESPEREGKIKKDYNDFLYALTSYREGKTIAFIASEIGRSRCTVYSWLKHAFPMHLIDKTKGAKKIDKKKLVKSKRFAYVLGFYQARARKIDRNDLSIKSCKPATLDSFVENMRFLFGDVRVQKKNSIYHIGYSSTRLMEFIKEITEDNTRIPDYISRNKGFIQAYLRGFFDSRLSITHTRITIKSSRFTREHPIAFVSKKNQQLLLQIRNALADLGICCSSYEKVLIIRRLKDIERFLRLGLVSNPKYARLNKLYTNHIELMKVDKNGEFEKVLEEIDKEKKDCQVKQQRKPILSC